MSTHGPKYARIVVASRLIGKEYICDVRIQTDRGNAYINKNLKRTVANTIAAAWARRLNIDVVNETKVVRDSPMETIENLEGGIR